MIESDICIFNKLDINALWNWLYSFESNSIPEIDNFYKEKLYYWGKLLIFLQEQFSSATYPTLRSWCGVTNASFKWLPGFEGNPSFPASGSKNGTGKIRRLQPCTAQEQKGNKL